jgi:hypothetical protein
MSCLGTATRCSALMSTAVRGRWRPRRRDWQSKPGAGRRPPRVPWACSAHRQPSRLIEIRSGRRYLSLGALIRHWRHTSVPRLARDGQRTRIRVSPRSLARRTSLVTTIACVDSCTSSSSARRRQSADRARSSSPRPIRTSMPTRRAAFRRLTSGSPRSTSSVGRRRHFSGSSHRSCGRCGCGRSGRGPRCGPVISAQCFRAFSAVARKPVLAVARF